MIQIKRRQGLHSLSQIGQAQIAVLSGQRCEETVRVFEGEAVVLEDEQVKQVWQEDIRRDPGLFARKREVV